MVMRVNGNAGAEQLGGQRFEKRIRFGNPATVAKRSRQDALRPQTRLDHMLNVLRPQSTVSSSR